MASNQHFLRSLVILLAVFTFTVHGRENGGALKKKSGSSTTSETGAVAGRPNQVQCSKGANKRHADPNDETKFYMCNYSSAHRIWMVFSFNCPSETVFDTRTQKCARRETIEEGNKSPALISHKPYQGLTVTGKPMRPTNHNHNHHVTTTNFANITRHRFPVRKNPIIVVTGRPSLSQRIRDQVKINVNYSTLKLRQTTTRYTPVTTPATTTTTTTTATELPSTTTLPFEPMGPLEIKSNSTDEILPSKHISVIRSVASKIAYLAQKIESLLTSIESSISNQKNGEDTIQMANPTLVNSPDFNKGQIAPASPEDEDSPSKEILSSAEETSSFMDNSKEVLPTMQLTTPSEESSEDPSAWTVFLHQVKPNLSNPNSNPSAPQKSQENSEPDNLSESQEEETPLKIQNVLENFFKTTNASQFQMIHPSSSGMITKDKVLSNFMVSPGAGGSLTEDSQEKTEAGIESGVKIKGSHRRPRMDDIWK